MKKFVLFLTLFAGIICAAEPAFHGNMLAALQENNPRIRAGLLIGILENSQAEECDKLALSILRDEFNAGVFDPTLVRRIFNLLKKYPSSREVVLLCADIAVKSENLPPESISAIRQALLHTDFSGCRELEKIKFSHLCDIAVSDFIAGKEYRKASEFLNRTAEKFPQTPAVLLNVLQRHISNCFYTLYTAPGLPGFQELPADDFWKCSINAIAAKLPLAKCQDGYDARCAVIGAIMLKLPQTEEMLKKYSKLYPDDSWTRISADAAAEFNDPKLLICGSNLFLNFNGMLTAGDFSAARQTVRQFKDLPRFYLQIMLTSAQGMHQEVIRMVKTSNYKFSQLPHQALFAIINSVHFQNDRAMAGKLLDFAREQLEKDQLSPIIANAIGYISADMDLRLQEAEKLIRLALNALPDEPSFRDSLAWVLFRQKRFAEAETAITSAIYHKHISRSISVIYLHAAAIKLAVNKKDDAAKYLAIAKKLYLADDPACAEYSMELQKQLEQLLK